MPMTKLLSATAGQRLALSHYAPGEECPPHRHGDAQVSLLIAGSYVEASDEGLVEVEGLSLSRKPSGFEHADRFGEAGALILSLQGPDAGPYEVRTCASLTGGRAALMEGADWPLARAQPSPPAKQWLREARCRLLAEPEERVATLARSLGLHPVHFARLFRSTFGCAPAQFRRDRRIARAIFQIVRSRLSLAEIASEQGFSDQAHMTRAVSTATGWSPGVLRRLLTT